MSQHPRMERAFLNAREPHRGVFATDYTDKSELPCHFLSV